MNERSLVRRIYTEKTIKKVEKKIKLLGINCKYNVIDLLNLRLLIGIAIFVLLLIFNKNGYILAPITVILFHYLSEYLVLDYQIKKREKKLEEEAIFFFEVLPFFVLWYFEESDNILRFLQNGKTEKES